jgi:hypothetical protein
LKERTWKRRPSLLEERRRETNEENDSKKSSSPMVSWLWRLTSSTSHNCLKNFFLSIYFYIGEICYREKDKDGGEEKAAGNVVGIW